jgi:hypothetical protein
VHVKTRIFSAKTGEKMRHPLEDQQRNVKTRTLQTPKRAAPENSVLGVVELGVLFGRVPHQPTRLKSMKRFCLTVHYT